MVGAVIIHYFIGVVSMISEMVWLNIEKNVRLERFNILAPPVIDSDPEVHGSVVTVSMITPFIFRGATFTVRTVTPFAFRRTTFSVRTRIMTMFGVFYAFVPLCSICGVLARHGFVGILLHHLVDTLLNRVFWW